MTKLVALILWTVMALPATSTGATSRYQPMLATSAGRDSLMRLAAWEDGRVTDGGKLFAYLKSDNPLVRLRAVEVIGRIQDAQDVVRILPLLKDPDDRVVRETVFALGQIGSREAAASLIAFNKKAPSDMKPGVAEAFGKIGGPEALAELTEMLRAFHASLRSAAVLAMARTEDETMVSSLLVMINDGDVRVATNAIYGLEKVESERVVKALIPFLRRDDPRLRAQAARTLGKQKAEDAVEELVRCLNDADHAVLINTANALATILDDSKEKKPVDALGRLTAKHPSHHVRKAAVIALGKIGHKNAKNYLAQTILDGQPGIRAESYLALARVLRKGAVVFIGSGLNDGDRMVRAAAVEALGLTGDDQQARELIEIAKTEQDPIIRAAAVRGLSNLDREAVTLALVGKLTDADFVVATEAATALGKLEAKDAVPALIERFTTPKGRTDQDVRLAIMEALVAMKAKEASVIAQKALEDGDRRLRTLAAKLLDEVGVARPELPGDRFFYERDFDRARGAALSLPFGVTHAVIRTEYGDIEVELYGDDATQTARNFIKLARAGKYKGNTFHRVVPNFVVQGGCPRGDGWGDPGYNIRSEFNQHPYDRGAVGIAHAGKDTGGSQFFITHSPQPHLNGRYTVFGHVIKGMEAVDAIKQGDTFDVIVLD